MKKRKIISLTCISLCIALMPLTVVHAQKATVSSSDKIVEDPDIAPMFTGGSHEMNRFITNSLQYPPDAVARNLQGLVVYTFVVEKDGTLSHFNIIHKADTLLNEEALRIIKSMPPWRPARHKGKIVRAESYVPMYFKLNKNAVAARRAPAGKGGNTGNAGNNVFAKTNQEILKNNDIYTIVDKMPRYATGEKGLRDFIGYNIRYPKDALQEGIQGEILCSFIVGADGAVSNIVVVKGLHPALDREAIRLLGIMPRWIPGENDGEKVNVKCLLLIDFTIDEEPISLLTETE